MARTLRSGRQPSLAAGSVARRGRGGGEAASVSHRLHDDPADRLHQRGGRRDRLPRIRAVLRAVVVEHHPAASQASQAPPSRASARAGSRPPRGGLLLSGKSGRAATSARVARVRPRPVTQVRAELWAPTTAGGSRRSGGADGSLVPGGPAHFATLLDTVIAEAARWLRSSASAARVMALRSAVSSRKLCERAFTLNYVPSGRDAGTDAFVVWLDERQPSSRERESLWRAHGAAAFRSGLGAA